MCDHEFISFKSVDVFVSHIVRCNVIFNRSPNNLLSLNTRLTQMKISLWKSESHLENIMKYFVKISVQ